MQYICNTDITLNLQNGEALSEALKTVPVLFQLLMKLSQLGKSPQPFGLTGHRKENSVARNDSWLLIILSLFLKQSKPSCLFPFNSSFSLCIAHLLKKKNKPTKTHFSSILEFVLISTLKSVLQFNETLLWLNM